MQTLDTAPWMPIARKHLGLAEIPGAKHQPAIVRMWQAIRQSIRDDETPWCAAFVGACLEDAGIASSRSAAARSYAQWGQATEPVVGAIVVLARPPHSWSGHVGFLEGFDRRGRPLILGGNQGNRVSVLPFDPARVIGYRLPRGWTASLPRAGVIDLAAGESSKDEA